MFSATKIKDQLNFEVRQALSIIIVIYSDSFNLWRLDSFNLWRLDSFKLWRLDSFNLWRLDSFNLWRLEIYPLLSTSLIQQPPCNEISIEWACT